MLRFFELSDLVPRNNKAVYSVFIDIHYLCERLIKKATCIGYFSFTIKDIYKTS